MIPLVMPLIPIFLLIAAGFVLRRFFFRDESFWHPLERLTYYVLFPALLITAISETRFDLATVGPLLAAVGGAILAMAAGLLLIRPRLGLDGPAFSSVFQGAIRFNTFVGLSAVGPLFGKEGLSLFAVIVAFMVPIVNVLSVYVLTHHASHRRFSLGRAARELAYNPLVIASLIGLAMSISGLSLPPGILQAADALGKASLSLGLLAVGAGLNAHAIRGNRAALVGGSCLKLLVLPLLTWLGIGIFGVDGFSASVAMLYAAQPTASSAFILARVLGGDHGLMAGLITVQTVLAFLTIPLVLRAIGV